MLLILFSFFYHTRSSNTINVTFDRPLLSACRKWKPGQPDNWGHGHDKGENCAGLVHEALWNDFFCEDLISYICEKEMQTCTSTRASLLHIHFNHIFLSVLILISFSYSTTAWIIVTRSNWVHSEQLDCTHVALGCSTWDGPCGESKGTILKWAQGCGGKHQSSADEMPFSSKVKPVQH